MSKELLLSNLLKEELSWKEKLEKLVELNLFSNDDVCNAIEHSRLLDTYLEIDSLRIEESLASNNKRDISTWVGLDPQTLQTPFSEIYSFLILLKEFNIKNLVDFGAGYGRIGILSWYLYDDVYFTGYEYIKERRVESIRILEKIGHDKFSIYDNDISKNDFNLPRGDLYFVYDFSDLQSIKKLCQKISKEFDKHNIFLVVRGKAMRSLIQQQFRELWALNGTIHTENWSLYSSFIDLDYLRDKYES